jgi:hypothetical protein
VFKDHPVNWKADVKVDGKVVKSGADGSADVELVDGAKHTIAIVPTASAPDDYFLATSATWKSGTSITINLPFKRENRRFAEQTWATEGLDTTKVGKVERPELMGHKVTVNKLVVPTVDKTNTEFAKLDKPVQEEITKSIWSIGGYNVRTTSKGAFSNHSTGCAIDINPIDATKQNWHMQKSDKQDKRLMELFQKVVRLDPAFKDYDPWKERDPDKILESSKKFNERFPRYLLDLIDEAFGAESGASQLAGALQTFVPFFDITTIKDALKSMVLGPELVETVTPKMLEEAAKAATKAKKPATAEALRAVAKDWSVLRAWIEGTVGWKDKEGKEHWAYASDYKKDHPGEDPAVMQGMVSLHPKLVSTLRAGGWTWLVDYHDNAQKDFMHFEDRAAQAALKK